eukprot:1347860-Rhodomonas_salina.1
MARAVLTLRGEVNLGAEFEGLLAGAADLVVGGQRRYEPKRHCHLVWQQPSLSSPLHSSASRAHRTQRMIGAASSGDGCGWRIPEGPSPPGACGRGDTPGASAPARPTAPATAIPDLT